MQKHRTRVRSLGLIEALKYLMPIFAIHGSLSCFLLISAFLPAACKSGISSELMSVPKYRVGSCSLFKILVGCMQAHLTTQGIPSTLLLPFPLQIMSIRIFSADLVFRLYHHSFAQLSRVSMVCLQDNTLLATIERI